MGHHITHGHGINFFLCGRQPVNGRATSHLTLLFPPALNKFVGTRPLGLWGFCWFSTLGSIGVLYLGSNNTQHTSTLPSSATYVRKKAPPHMVQYKHVSFDLVVVIVASEEALPCLVPLFAATPLVFLSSPARRGLYTACMHLRQSTLSNPEHCVAAPCWGHAHR